MDVKNMELLIENNEAPILTEHFNKTFWDVIDMDVLFNKFWSLEEITAKDPLWVRTFDLELLKWAFFAFMELGGKITEVPTCSDFFAVDFSKYIEEYGFDYTDKYDLKDDN